MAREKIEHLVEQLVNEIIRTTEMELVDVEYTREREWYLRVFLNKAGGIDLDDCQWVSERLEAKLDELDPIRDAYYLEVSSPGLDRPLKKDRDFERNIGATIEVQMFAPFEGYGKIIVGILVGLTEKNELKIRVDDNEFNIPREKISIVRLHIIF